MQSVPVLDLDKPLEEPSTVYTVTNGSGASSVPSSVGELFSTVISRTVTVTSPPSATVKPNTTPEKKIANGEASNMHHKEKDVQEGSSHTSEEDKSQIKKPKKPKKGSDDEDGNEDEDEEIEDEEEDEEDDVKDDRRKQISSKDKRKEEEKKKKRKRRSYEKRRTKDNGEDGERKKSKSKRKYDSGSDRSTSEEETARKKRRSKKNTHSHRHRQKEEEEEEEEEGLVYETTEQKIKNLKSRVRRCGFRLKGLTRKMTAREKLAHIKDFIKENEKYGLKVHMTEGEIDQLRDKMRRVNETAELEAMQFPKQDKTHVRRARKKNINYSLKFPKVADKDFDTYKTPSTSSED